MKKKIFISLFFVLSLIVLVGCEKKPPAEATAPTFTGLDPVEVLIGEEFDPLDGVKATDEIDGDITKDIVVDGTVNTNKAGVYELTYSVKNKAGLETKKKRFVTVTGLAGFSNGDFSDGLEGWSTWINEGEGWEADVYVEDGEAVVDITKTSAESFNNWWDVQLKQTSITFKPFESFTLEFTVRAEAPRKLMLNLQGGGLVDKAIDMRMFDLTTEDQTFSVDFFSKYEAMNAELQFAMGTFHKVEGVPLAEQTVAGKVYFSNMSITRGPELENQAPMIVANDILLRVGDDSFLQYQGVSVSDDRDIVEVKDIVFEDITEGEKFKFGEPAVKGVYTFKYSITDSGGLSSEVIRRVTVAEPFEIPPLTEVDENGIPVGWTVWHEPDRGGITVTADEGVVEIDITKVGEHPWENQFKVLDLGAFKGEYILRFAARADVARAMKVAMEGDGGVGIPNLSEVYNLTTGFVVYEIPFEIDKNAVNTNRNLQFWFGDLSGEEGVGENANELTKVYLKDISIESVGATLPIGWEVSIQPAPHSVIEVDVVDGVIMVDIISVEGADWRARLRTKKMNLEAGKRYIYTFEAKADDERYLRTLFEGAGFANQYSNLHLTTEYQTYTYIFEAEQDAYEKHFDFGFGELKTTRATGDELTFTEDDDILTRVYIKNFNITIEEFELPAGFAINTQMTDALPEGWREINGTGQYYDLSVVDGVIEIDMKEMADADWKAAIASNKFLMKAGETYTVKFWAKADDARYIRLMVEGSQMVNAYDHVHITEEWTEFTIVYEAVSNVAAREFKLNWGSLLTGRTYPGGYEFDAADNIITKLYFKDFSVTIS